MELDYESVVKKSPPLAKTSIVVALAFLGCAIGLVVSRFVEMEYGPCTLTFSVLSGIGAVAWGGFTIFQIRYVENKKRG